MGQRLVEKLVRSLPPPAKGNRITYDDAIPGFGVRTTAAGAKAFILNYHLAGQERRLTIGGHPAWTVQAARHEATRLRRLVDQGQDPLGQRQEAREAPTVARLWAAYEVKHLVKLAPRGQKDVRAMWKTYILPKLGSVKLDKLGAAEVDDLHRAITRLHRVRANRVIENFRSALNLAVRWEWIDRNPANGFDKNREQPKEVFLTGEQLAEAFTCLGRMPNQKAANAIKLLMLTGARLGEVLSAEWPQFDLEQAVWKKPPSHTKQKRQHRVPLSEAAKQLLLNMKETASGNYLFPGTNGHPVADIKKPWTWLKNEIGVPYLRLHDLRHTFASLLISSGETLPVIGRLLGHSQSQTTMRYAHLMDDPLRRAAAKIGNLVG